MTYANFRVFSVGMKLKYFDFNHKECLWYKLLAYILIYDIRGAYYIAYEYNISSIADL